MNRASLTLPRQLTSGMPAMLTVSILAALIASGAAWGDSVVRTDGRRLDGVEILAATHEQVTYKDADGQTSQLSAESVESIERDSEALDGPRRLMQSGEYKKAAKAFYELEPSAEWEKAEAAYRVGYCALKADDGKLATQAFKKYLSDYRESKDWWVPHAIYGLGMAALELGQPKTAETHFKELPAFGRNWSQRAVMGEAHALRIAEKFVESRSLFNKIISNPRLPVGLRHEAMVGYARTQLEQEQFGPVIDKLNSWFFDGALATEIVYSEWRARATLLMARAYLARGEKSDLEMAEIWLLKVAALYGEYPSVYKEACLELAGLYEKMGLADRIDEWKQRAAAAS